MSVFRLFPQDACGVALMGAAVVEIVAAHPAAAWCGSVFELKHPVLFAVLLPVAWIAPLMCFGINYLVANIGVILDTVTPHAFFLNASPRTD